MPRLRYQMMLAAWVLSDLRCGRLLGAIYWCYVRLRWFCRTGALWPGRALRVVHGAAQPPGDSERSILTSPDGVIHQQRLESAAWDCASITELRDLEWWYRSGIEDLVATREARLADERATALLLANLTNQQRRQYAADRYFDVIGGQSRRHYRIWHRSQQNIEEIDRFGNRRCIWCVHPTGVAMGDVLLAQKVALELFEFDALEIAHCYSDFAASPAPDLHYWRA
jgi:hypothetical protein